MANLWEGSGQVLVDGNGARKRRPRGKGQANPCECGNHVWAAATKAVVTLVSPRAKDLLLQRNWIALKNGYVATSSYGKTIYLHRAVMGSEPGQIVDHINFNKSDNRDENLRHATATENVAWRRWKSEFKGIRKHRHKWTARISVAGKGIHLGSFKSASEASAAYNEAAKKHYGEFARLNSGV